MARMTKLDRSEEFRAVVTAPWGEVAYGPYARKSDAKAALTRENRDWRTREVKYPERIERTELKWEVVE